MFRGKSCVDIGCGAGGKTMYYAGLGVERITGIEILEKYQTEAEALAASLGLADCFTFICRDASDTGMSDASVDTIIMNDAMEHVADPTAVLAECRRILKPGGRLYVNFPPYNHPFGAHLSDLIGIPWVHLFFSDKTLIELYKELAAPLPDGAERIEFRISDGPHGPYFSYINRMTIKRFKKLAANSGMRLFGYDEIPLRPFLAPLAAVPGLKECFVKMAVAVFEK